MFEGIVLGGLTFLGFFAIYRNTPEFIKNIISSRGLRIFFDLGLTIGTYFLLSGISSSFASAVGCAVTGLLLSFSLSLTRKKRRNNV